MPNSYHRNYADAVSNIYQNMGQAQANARLQQGQGWANAFGQIGQTVAAIPGQLQDQKNAESQRQRMARQDEIQEWTFQQARNKAHDQSVLAQVASSSMVNGKYDFDKMMGAGQQAGVPMESLTEAIGRLRQFEASDVQLQTALTQGKITQMQYEGAMLENFSKEAILANFQPEAMGLIFQTAADKGMDIAQWKKVWETDPKALAAELQKRYGGPPAPTREIKTRNADGSETIQIVKDTPGQKFTSAAETILDIDKAIMAARARGDHAEMRSLLNLKAKSAAATRGPEKADFQRIETVDAQGNPTIQFMTPDEVRSQGGVATRGTGGGTLSAGAQEKLAGIDSSLALLDTLDKMLPKVENYLGPASGRAMQAAQVIPGVPVNADFARFDAESSTLENTTIKAITGAQMAETEAARIMRQIPRPIDKPIVWKEKHKATLENLEMMRKRILELSGRTGGRAAGPGPGSSGGPGGSGAGDNIDRDPTSPTFGQPRGRR